MKKTFLWASIVALFLCSCEKKWVESVRLIPQADHVNIGKGAVALAHLKSIQTPEGWGMAASNFMGDVEKTLGLSVHAVDDGASIRVESSDNLPAEACSTSAGRAYALWHPISGGRATD